MDTLSATRAPIKRTERTYTQQQREEVAAVYLTTASLRKTSELTRVAYATIQDWTKQDWWAPAVDRIRSQYQEELEARISSALFKALDQLDDRLNNGDVSVTKHGDVVRHPVRARDLGIISSILFDKRQIIRHQPTSITASDSRLQTLADKLAQLGAPKPVQTIDNGTDPAQPASERG